MRPHIPRLVALFLLAFAASSAPAGPVPANKPAHYPDWWFELDVIPRLPAAATKPNPVWPTDYAAADDFAAANIGQLKHIANKASQAMDEILAPVGAGQEVNGFVGPWSLSPQGGVVRDDYAVLNHGQLKAVAHLFYRRLRQVGYLGAPLSQGRLYPWDGAKAPADGYATVNLGQLKYMFSFFSGPLLLDSYLADSDLDGIPDGWELEHELNPLDPADADEPAGAGLTWLGLYQQSLGHGADPVAANVVGLLVYSP